MSLFPLILSWNAQALVLVLLVSSKNRASAKVKQWKKRESVKRLVKKRYMV